MIKKFDAFINEGVDVKDKISEITEVMPLLYELLDKVKEEYKGDYFIIYKDVPSKDHIEPFVCAHKNSKLIVLSDAIDILELKGNTDKIVKDIAHSAKKNDINSHLSYGDPEEEEEYDE